MAPVECDYALHYKQPLLAIVQVLKEWTQCLEGSEPHFKVLTDYKNLIQLTTSRELTDREIR